jgi:hypothetical protein
MLVRTLLGIDLVVAPDGPVSSLPEQFSRSAC